MSALLRSFFIIASIFVNIIGSSPIPSIVVKSIENRTPFSVCFVDRYTQPPSVIAMSPSSITEYNYSINNCQDISIEDLDSKNFFVKSDYFSHRARFKVALLASNGTRKEGKSSYAHIGIDSDSVDGANNAMIFRYGHPHTGSLYSATWHLSRCCNCNSGQVVEVECADCQDALEASIACKPVTLDVQLNMEQQDIQDDTGRVSLGYRIRQK